MNGSTANGAASALVNRSQTDVVIDGIKAMITSGELGPGSRLPIEKELAALLGVSRGSLREGVRALAILGVLETRQGDGTYVTSLDPLLLLSPLGFLADLQTPGTAEQLLAVRRVLETESAARAAEQIGDDELTELGEILDALEPIVDRASEADLTTFFEADARFHSIIARASGNPALAGLIESLVGRTVRARLWRAVAQRGAVREAQNEHRAILTELQRHDADRARIRMSVHVLGAEEFAKDHAPIPTTPLDANTAG